jgi:Phage integrase, N-terminal SAM-like domain
MKAGSPNTLARALRGFFADHLPRVRGTSPHTIHSYRDTFVLLLRFLADRGRRSVADLDVEDLGPQDVLEFLHHLEVERRNIAATRNVRLAAIHAFFRYCAAEHPERIEHCQRVLAVPSSALAHVPSSIWSSPRFRRCSRRLTGPRPMVAATTRSWRACSTRARESRRSSRSGSRIFVWSRRRTFVSSGRDARNVSARSGHRPPTSCVRFSLNAATHHEMIDHSLSIIGVDLSRDSACATS